MRGLITAVLVGIAMTAACSEDTPTTPPVEIPPAQVIGGPCDNSEGCFGDYVCCDGGIFSVDGRGTCAREGYCAATTACDGAPCGGGLECCAFPEFGTSVCLTPGVCERRPGEGGMGGMGGSFGGMGGMGGAGGVLSALPPYTVVSGVETLTLGCLDSRGAGLLPLHVALDMPFAGVETIIVRGRLEPIVGGSAGEVVGNIQVCAGGMINAGDVTGCPRGRGLLDVMAGSGSVTVIDAMGMNGASVPYTPMANAVDYELRINVDTPNETLAADLTLDGVQSTQAIGMMLGMPSGTVVSVLINQGTVCAVTR